MQPTLILVSRKATAKSVASSFGATIVPITPKFKEIRSLTEGLAKGKCFVGFIQTLATGWNAPSDTQVVIHPECEKDVDLELIEQARQRPKSVATKDQPSLELKTMEGMKKKDRIQELESRLLMLLKAVIPFSDFGRNLRYHGMSTSKDCWVMTKDASGNVSHLQNKGTNVSELMDVDLLTSYLVNKDYKPNKDQSHLADLPNSQIGELSVQDFVNLGMLVQHILMTPPEAPEPNPLPPDVKKPQSKPVNLELAKAQIESLAKKHKKIKHKKKSKGKQDETNS